jgi:LETM1 and EF-hand domain-containing protein 1
MSLWLPRTSPTLFARTYSRPQHTIYSHVKSILVLRSHPLAPRRAAAVVSSRRLQSSKASPGSSTQEKQNVSVDPAASLETKASPPTPKEPKQAPLMTRAWKKVKHEAAHYWHGSKLLVSEVRISARLQWKILHGESLTRRERRQVRLEDLLLSTI